MSQERTDVVFVGRGKDEDGVEVDVLKDTLTGAQYLAYSIEQWEARCERLNQQAKRQAREATIIGNS